MGNSSGTGVGGSWSLEREPRLVNLEIPQGKRERSWALERCLR